MRARLPLDCMLWLALWSCSQLPAAETPAKTELPTAAVAPAAPAAKTPAPAALVEPLVPAIARELTFGLRLAEAKRRWPQLFAADGVRDEALAARVHAVIEPSETFNRVKLVFATPEQLEQTLASWGTPPLTGNDGYGHEVRAYVHPNGRLRVIALADATSDVCNATRDMLDACSLYLDESWPLETYLGLWGLIDGEKPLLHSTVAELRARFGDRFVTRGTEVYARLPTFGIMASASLSFDLKDDRVAQVLTVLREASAVTQGARVIELARGRYGGPKPGAHGTQIFGARAPRFTVRLEGGLDSVEIRDLDHCPDEELRLAEWMQARAAAAPRAQLEQSRGLPYPLLRERTTTQAGCRDTYRTFDFEWLECDPRIRNERVVTTDCCDRACPADPVGWMLRLEEAVQRKDVAAVRAMLPPDRPVAIHYRDGTEEADERRWVLTRKKTPLDGLALILDGEYIPQCPPDGQVMDEEASSASSTDVIECLYGEGHQCGAIFKWSGDAKQLFLESVEFDCC